MLPRAIRLSALAAALLTGAGAAETQACCWFGGGWGAFRPLTWGAYRPYTSFYGGGWGYGAGYGGSYGGGCCSTGCCSSGCSPCSTGACGSTSYFGVSGCSSCATGDSTYSSGYAPGTEPQPDPAGARSNGDRPADPATDDFRGEGDYGTERDIRNNSSGSSIPPAERSSIPPANRSSIPSTPPENRSSIPMNPPAENRSSIPMNPPAGDPFPAGDDAPMWRNTPAPQEPAGTDGNAPPVTTGPEIQRVQPLDLEQPVASRYHVQRQRVSVRSVYKTPAVARTVVGPNDGWAPVSDNSRVASSR